MKFKLKENVTPKIKVGDVIITNDDTVYIIARTEHGNARATYSLFDVNRGQMSYDWSNLEDFIEHIRTSKGIRRVIPNEKITLVEE